MLNTIEQLKRLEFLNLPNIEKSKKMLSEKFLINFNDYEWFDDKLRFNLGYKEKSFYEWAKKNNNKEIISNIDKIVKYLLINYRINLNDVFSCKIDDDLYWKANGILDKYVFNNMGINLSMFIEKEKFETGEIKLQDCLEKFLNIDKELKNKAMKQYDDYNLLDNQQRHNILKNYIENLKKISDEEIKFFQNRNIIPEKVSKKTGMFLINKCYSNVFMHILNSWRIYPYKECDEIRYKNLIDFIKEFIKKDITIVELVMFEDILYVFLNKYIYITMDYLIPNYIKHGELEDREKENLKIRLEILKNLPNTIEVNKILAVILEYSDKLDIESFIVSLSKLVLSLSEYYIPLYNYVFANILNELCKIREKEIGDFLKENYENDIKEDIKKEYQGNINEEIKQSVIKKGDMLNREKKIDKILNLFSDNNILKEEMIKDREEYQIALGKFLQNGILFNLK